MQNTVKLLIVAAATIKFQYIQGPILLSKLKKVTKDAATNKVNMTLFSFKMSVNYSTSELMS